MCIRDSIYAIVVQLVQLLVVDLVNSTVDSNLGENVLLVNSFLNKALQNAGNGLSLYYGVLSIAELLGRDVYKRQQSVSGRVRPR